MLDPDDAPELIPPAPPAGWRQRLEVYAERFDLTPTRLLVGVVVLTALAVAGWRVLAPPAPPPELTLPAAEGAATEGPATGQPAGSDDASSAPSPSTGVGQPTAVGASGAPAGGGASGSPGEPSEVVVHVAGAVASPGVQRLPPGARVIDAVEAAGGADADADMARLNLAALLVDAEQIYVPRVGEQPPLPLATGDAGGPGGDAADDRVNINQAAADALEELPGVGPVTAQAIVDHRDEHGPFGSVDQLMDVRGIGEAKLEQLRDLAVL